MSADERTAEWIDISMPLGSGMPHWPGDPEVRIERIASMEQGAVCNLTSLSMAAHTGTHIDAPVHFLPDGSGMEAMPLDVTLGPARVVEISDPVAVRAHELEPLCLKRGERVLFKSRNSRVRAGAFVEDFVYVARDAARVLGETGIRLVGIDSLSVGGFHHDLVETHRILLSAGVWILEGLDLSAVAPGEYELICLPLRIPGADGAPARAVLRRPVATEERRSLDQRAPRRVGERRPAVPVCGPARR